MICISHLETTVLTIFVWGPVVISPVCYLFSRTSEEIRGEILFVLYKFSALQFTEQNADGIEVLSLLCPKLLCLSLEALAKTQRDDVRLNCVGSYELYLCASFLCMRQISTSNSWRWISSNCHLPLLKFLFLEHHINMLNAFPYSRPFSV